MVLTQGSGSGNLAEGSCAHFIVRQDAELVVVGRRQACHLQPGARGGGHRHREPVLLPIIITRWNLLHPAEGERAREKEWEQKSGRECWESGFMKHDRKVGFINHSYSSSAPDFVAETALMYPCNCTESLQLQLWWFSCSYRSWGSARLFYTEQITWPQAKENPVHLFTYSKVEELLKIFNVSLKIRRFFSLFEDGGFDSTEAACSIVRTWKKGRTLLTITKRGSFWGVLSVVWQPCMLLRRTKQVIFITQNIRAEINSQIVWVLFPVL